MDVNPRVIFIVGYVDNFINVAKNLIQFFFLYFPSKKVKSTRITLIPIDICPDNSSFVTRPFLTVSYVILI